MNKQENAIHLVEQAVRALATGPDDVKRRLRNAFMYHLVVMSSNRMSQRSWRQGCHQFVSVLPANRDTKAKVQSSLPSFVCTSALLQRLP